MSNAVLVLALAISIASPAWGRTWSGCGVRFDVPPRWRVVAGERKPLGPRADDVKPRCTLHLVPPQWELTRALVVHEMSDYAIEITVANVDFIKAAHDAGFYRTFELCRSWERPDNCMEVHERLGWWLHGRMTWRNPVTPMANEHWRGLIASANYGRYRKEGGYDGLGTFWSAVLNDRSGTSAILFEYTDERYEREFRSIVRSFRFEK